MKAMRAALAGLQLLAAAAATANAQSPPPDPPVPPLLIAVAGPYSDPASPHARELRLGAELAAETLNAAGGILGRTVALAFADDGGCDIGTSASEAQRILEHRPALIVGHPCAPAAHAAAQVYGTARVLFIAPSSRHPALTDRRTAPTIFRLAGRDDRQGSDAARAMTRNWPGRRIAIVHDLSAASRRLADAVRDELKALNAAPAHMAGLVAGERDYARIVEGLKTAAAEVVFLALFPPEAAIVTRLARAQLPGLHVVTGDAAGTAELVALLGPDGEGVMTMRAEGDAVPPVPESVLARLAGRGAIPSPLMLHTMAAIEAWSAAARDLGSIDAERIAARLLEQPHDTVLGRLSFTGNGDARLPSFGLRELSGGAWARPPSRGK